MIHGTLSKRIDIKPNIKFKQNKKKLSLNILDEIPASNLKIYFINDVPEWIALDENYNGKVDDNEIKYFSKGQNFIELNVDLYANRIIYSKNKKFRTSQVNTAPTKFDVILSNNSKIKDIKILNKFSNKSFFAEKNKIDGSQMTLYNKVSNYMQV